MSGQFLAAGSISALEQRFVNLVRSAKADGALAPVSVIVGSNLQHVHLRRLLAR